MTSRMYTSKADVYSFGVLLFEIFSNGSTPYADLAVAEIVPMVAHAGHRLGRPSPATSEGIVDLIRNCTQMNVARRPAMAAVKAWLEQATATGNLHARFVASVANNSLDGEGLELPRRKPGQVLQAWMLSDEDEMLLGGDKTAEEGDVDNQTESTL